MVGALDNGFRDQGPEDLELRAAETLAGAGGGADRAMVLDEEEGEFRRQVRMLPAEEGLEAVILAGVGYSWILAILGSM